MSILSNGGPVVLAIPPSAPPTHYTSTTQLTVKSTSNNAGIFLCYSLHSPIAHVLKRFTTAGLEWREADREATLLLSLSHPNNTKLHSWYIVPDRSEGGMYMEHCDQGDLLDWTIKNRAEFERTGTLIPEEFIWHVFESLTCAIAYLHHEKYIIHSDLNPSNIFLSSYDQNGNKEIGPFPRIVLGDFGISLVIVDRSQIDRASNDERSFDMSGIAIVVEYLLETSTHSKELDALLKLCSGFEVTAAMLLTKIREARARRQNE